MRGMFSLGMGKSKHIVLPISEYGVGFRVFSVHVAQFDLSFVTELAVIPYFRVLALIFPQKVAVARHFLTCFCL